MIVLNHFIHYCRAQLFSFFLYVCLSIFLFVVLRIFFYRYSFIVKEVNLNEIEREGARKSRDLSLLYREKTRFISERKAICTCLIASYG